MTPTTATSSTSIIYRVNVSVNDQHADALLARPSSSSTSSTLTRLDPPPSSLQSSLSRCLLLSPFFFYNSIKVVKMLRKSASENIILKSVYTLRVDGHAIYIICILILTMVVMQVAREALQQERTRLNRGRRRAGVGPASRVGPRCPADWTSKQMAYKSDFPRRPIEILAR